MGAAERLRSKSGGQCLMYVYFIQEDKRCYSFYIYCLLFIQLITRNSFICSVPAGFTVCVESSCELFDERINAVLEKGELCQKMV